MQLLLALIGAALGVAVFVGVDLANDSSRRAFQYSEELLFGRATHQLLGIGGALTSEQYRTLRLQSGPLLAAPVIETEVIVRTPMVERRMTLIGIDPFEEMDFRSYSGFGAADDASMLTLITRPGAVLAPAALAAELGLDTGSTLDLLLEDDRVATVEVAGLIEDGGTPTDGIAPLVADIATAQELLGRETIDRVDLLLTPEAERRLENLLPAGVTLVTAGSRNRVSDELSRAFSINLSALSLLAMLVGVFLIYATVSFTVLQRRSVFGMFRALGVQRASLLASVLLEALLIGGAATVLGLALGHVLAQGLVELTLRTMDDLYFSDVVRPAAPSGWLYLKGFGIGIGAALAAAAVPAYEAARVSPQVAMSRAALERKARKLTHAGAALALPCAAAGALVLLASDRSLTAAFAGLFFVIIAFALLIPTCAALALRALERLARPTFGSPGSLAIRGVARSLSRTGVATAALGVAVATVIGVGLMIASFRVSVERWLESTLLADLYVDAEGWAVSARDPLADRNLGSIAELPGVRGLSLLQFRRLPTALGELSLRAVLPGPDGWGLTVVDELFPGTVEAMARGEGIFASETLAYRNALAVGDTLVLPADGGSVEFRLIGIYRDYNTDGGGVLMPIEIYQRHWADRDIDGVGIYLTASADPASVRAEIEARLGGFRNLRLRSTEAIRNQSLAVFDRTFRVTEVLRVLAGIVAFLGLMSALLSIELDRGREIAVLRALGLTPRRVGILSLTQTLLLGGIAGLLSIPLGIVMAKLLIDVINRRSFGWGMELTVNAPPIALGFALAVAAALLAGIYPAYHVSRLSVAAGLREE
ncbi:MAG TPA: ABC transporter permease [Gammaproteobacteria bacterium]